MNEIKKNISIKEKGRLPLYYDGIAELMHTVTELYLMRRGYEYFRAFKQLYSRVHTQLDGGRREYFQERIRVLEDIYGYELVWQSEAGYSPELKQKKQYERNHSLLRDVYSLQLELYIDLENTDLFKFLKQNVNDMEMI